MELTELLGANAERVVVPQEYRYSVIAEHNGEVLSPRDAGRKIILVDRSALADDGSDSLADEAVVKRVGKPDKLAGAVVS